jgi:hypothetical protein
MRKTRLSEIVLVFIITAVAYGYFFSQQDANTNTRLALVKAIVEQRRLEIDSYHDSVLDTIDKAYYNGHYYSDKAIGTSLIAVPIYYAILRTNNWLGNTLTIKGFKELLTFFGISLLCACLAPLLYLFVKHISASARYALLATLAICLGTPLYLYSTTFYSHAQVGLFLFVAFYIWFRARQDGTITLAKTALSGFLLGYAFISEYPSALIAAVLGCYILYVTREQGRLKDWKPYLAFFAGACIPLALMMIYNYSIFKNPLSLGYLHEAEEQFRTGMQAGFIGLGLPDPRVIFYTTFHTSMGIFWQSPILLLAFPGWIAMWRNPQYRPEAAFSLGVILLYFVALSGYYMWWGGLSFTPRHLIPVLPFFGIPLAFLPKQFRMVLLLLALVSIAQMLVVTSTTYFGLYEMLKNISTDRFYAMFQNSTIYTIYLPNFLSQSLSTNRGQEFFGLKGHLSLLPLLIAETILLILFIVLTRTPKTEVPDEPAKLL